MYISVSYANRQSIINFIRSLWYLLPSGFIPVAIIPVMCGLFLYLLAFKIITLSLAEPQPTLKL